MKKRAVSTRAHTCVCVYTCLRALANKFDTNIKFIHIYLLYACVYTIHNGFAPVFVLLLLPLTLVHSRTCASRRSLLLACQIEEAKVKTVTEKSINGCVCAWDLALCVCVGVSGRVVVVVVALPMYVCWQSWRWRWSMAYRDRMDRTSGWLAGFALLSFTWLTNCWLLTNWLAMLTGIGTLLFLFVSQSVSKIRSMSNDVFNRYTTVRVF